MKKLSAIIMFLILSITTVYAELTVSGSVGAGVIALKGSNVKDKGELDSMRAGSSYLSGQIEVSAQDEAEKFGGFVKFSAELVPRRVEDPADLNKLFVDSWTWKAAAWWKPFYFTRIQLGHIEEFAMTDIVGWGYHANDAESYVISPKESYAGDYFSQSAGFYAGTGTNWLGATLTINPIYGLYINIAIPFGLGYRFERDPQEYLNNPGDQINDYLGRDEQDIASRVYLFTHAQVSYELWNIGRIAFTFAGNGDGTLELYPTSYPDTFLRYQGQDLNFRQIYKSNSPELYASFFLTYLEDKGIGLNVGFAYTMPAETADGTVTYNAPMEAGLGFSFGSEKRGIKARFAVSFGGKLTRTTDSSTVNEPVMLGFGVLPYMTLGPCKIHLNVGISYKFEDEYMTETIPYTVKAVGNSAAFGWYANPYVTFSFGSGTFFAGVQLECDGLKYTGHKTKKQGYPNAAGAIEGTEVIEWRVPVGIQFAF